MPTISTSSPTNSTQKSVKSILVMLMTLCAFSITSTTFAKDSDKTFFGKPAKGKWIIGVKAAQIDNNVEEIKDADAGGIVLGYEFARPVGSGSSTVELEYIKSIDTSLLGVAEYDINALNLFFTYRSPGTLYFKAKAGLSYTDLAIKSVGLNTSQEDVSLAAGIGLGYHIGDYGVIEIEYSGDSGDSDIGILGLNALLEF